MWTPEYQTDIIYKLTMFLEAYNFDFAKKK